MSSVFGISATDIENRLPEFIPQGHALVCYVTSIVILLFMFINSHIFLPNVPVWLFLGAFLIAVIMINHASFQQNPYRTQAQAPENEQVNVPTFVRREHLPDIRIQLADLNREFDDSDYDALRALDVDVAPNLFGISSEDIHALPTYKYNVQSHQHIQTAQDCNIRDEIAVEKNELSCCICLEQVKEGDLLIRLPCTHEFHAHCIILWLQQQGTCPICKHWAGRAR